MKILFKIFILILSTLLIQNKAFSYSKNSGKVSVTVSVSKADKSGDKSVGVKTEASASKSIENITNSSKDNAPNSKTADTPSVQDNSSEQSYSNDNNDTSSDDYYDRNNFGNKINGYKSIHTAVIGSNKKPIEIQIRTKKCMNLLKEG